MTPEVDRNADQKQKAGYRSVVNFFFELGMLKKTPRSGFQFLGSGQESVADHTFRAALIGFSLARLDGTSDPFHVACLCLFHDIAEARTGDLNYMNKRYVQAHEHRAVTDLTESLPFAGEVVTLLEEYRSAGTLAAKLAHDADQLDLILELKEQSDLGNKYAVQWIPYVEKRLLTSVGKTIAEEILRTDFNAWWFEGDEH